MPDLQLAAGQKIQSLAYPLRGVTGRPDGEKRYPAHFAASLS